MSSLRCLAALLRRGRFAARAQQPRRPSIGYLGATTARGRHPDGSTEGLEGLEAGPGSSGSALAGVVGRTDRRRSQVPRRIRLEGGAGAPCAGVPGLAPACAPAGRGPTLLYDRACKSVASQCAPNIILIPLVIETPARKDKWLCSSNPNGPPFSPRPDRTSLLRACRPAECYYRHRQT